VALVVLAIVALSLAFLAVVFGAVRQGESRHRAMAGQALGTWRCNSLPGHEQRAGCLAALSAAAASSLQAPP
jgi:hypothetical protein